MIHRLDQGAGVGLIADTIKTHGIKALEDVTAFAMQRCATVDLIKAQNVLKTGDDALLARCSA